MLEGGNGRNYNEKGVWYILLKPCDGSHGRADHQQAATLIEMKY